MHALLYTCTIRHTYNIFQLVNEAGMSYNMSEELFEFLDQVQELVNTSADNREKLASRENLLLSREYWKQSERLSVGPDNRYLLPRQTLVYKYMFA